MDMSYCGDKTGFPDLVTNNKKISCTKFFEKDKDILIEQSIIDIIRKCFYTSVQKIFAELLYTSMCMLMHTLYMHKLITMSLQYGRALCIHVCVCVVCVCVCVCVCTCMHVYTHDCVCNLCMCLHMEACSNTFSI